MSPYYMNSFCTYCILVLKTYLTIFNSYPKEIIMLIIEMMCSYPKVYCGPICTAFIINNDIYICGRNKLIPKKQIFNEGKFDSICYGLSHAIFIDKSKKVIYSQSTNSDG